MLLIPIVLSGVILFRHWPYYLTAVRDLYGWATRMVSYFIALYHLVMLSRPAYQQAIAYRRVILAGC